MVLTITACSQLKESRYHDTTALEIPPTMKVVAKPTSVKNTVDNREDKELGDSVVLSGSEQVPVIKIKKLFNRSWKLVDQALKLNDIEVKDKNRGLGVFYVVFVADNHGTGKISTFDKIVSYFLTNTSSKASYKLLVTWHDNNTEVSASLVNESSDDLLDDDEDREDFEATIDNSATLIELLYQTIKQDLLLISEP